MDTFGASENCKGPLGKGFVALLLGLICGAVLGFGQPARAVDVASSQGIYATLVELDNSSRPSPQARGHSDPYSALTSFAQTIADKPKAGGAEWGDDANRQPDGGIYAAYAALGKFAQNLASDRPVSRQTGQKFAEADNIFDALKEFNSGSGAQPAAPQAQQPGAKGAPGVTTKAVVPVNAVFLGDKVCMTCHASYAEAFSKTLMGKIGKTQPGKFACENCHGPGSTHVKLGGGRGVGGIISFRVDDLSRTAEENNAVCLTCHEKGNRSLWAGSVHEERGLSCTNCHTVMKNVSRKAQLKTEFQPDTCYQCHQNKRAQMYRTSHMPVSETGTIDTPARVGKIVCTNCHNPHGSYTESLLKKATVNDVCFQCHAEKRGPFLWEHPPVTESCLNCHDPHGSNNDFLLKISRPRLCQQCHSGGQHNSNPRNPAVTLYAQGRECQNCHSNHHGSNNPAGARFMR